MAQYKAFYSIYSNDKSLERDSRIYCFDAKDDMEAKGIAKEREYGLRNNPDVNRADLLSLVEIIEREVPLR